MNYKNYKNKYIKYKTKYLEYLKQNGGSSSECNKISNIIKYEDWIKKTINKKHLITLHNNSVKNLMIPSDILMKNYHIFNNVIKNKNNVADQKGSGRCWMFAALNVIRHKFINDNKLKNSFEFSENYLFFWDKFERVNYSLNLLTKLHKKYISLDSRLIDYLLNEMLSDGGQWQMFINLTYRET